MNVNASLFAQVVVFLILVWFGMKFIWPALRNALDERAAKVKEAMDAAELGKEQLALSGERSQRIVDAARQQAAKQLADYDRRAQTVIEDANRIAAREAERIVASARTEAGQLVERASVELRGQVAGIAVAAAEEILRKEIDAATHARLVSQMDQEI